MTTPLKNSAGGWSEKNCDSVGGKSKIFPQVGVSEKFWDSVGGWSEKIAILRVGGLTSRVWSPFPLTFNGIALTHSQMFLFNNRRSLAAVRRRLPPYKLRAKRTSIISQLNVPHSKTKWRVWKKLFSREITKLNTSHPPLNSSWLNWKRKGMVMRLHS